MFHTISNYVRGVLIFFKISLQGFVNVLTVNMLIRIHYCEPIKRNIARKGRNEAEEMAEMRQRKCNSKADKTK